MDENPLKDGPNFSFTICYIAKQTNKQKYNGPWAVIDYEQSLFFLSPYRERYARDTQMTTHATEGASFLASAPPPPPRARNPSHSGAVTSRKNGTTVTRGFRRSYGLIWPGGCPVQYFLDVYKFR